MAQPAPNDLLLDSADTGTRFVMLVVLMMTALATIAVGGALIVGALRGTWVDAVAGNITIEIPASDGKGIVRSPETLADTAKTIEANLVKIDGVATAHALDRRDVEKLVKPWMGDAAGTADMPLPALMGVTLKDPDDQAVIKAVDASVMATDSAAIIETHQTWLSDLRRFSLVLLLAACAMAAVTIACCIVAVAGAVAARLSEHHSDIDLLHVMGATDAYIGKQFVEVVVKSVGGAAIAGTILGFLMLKAGGLVAGSIQSAVLPNLSWGIVDYLCFLALPALVTGLCFLAARVTVLRTLRTMP